MSVLDAPVVTAAEPEAEVAGRSLKAIMWSRLRRDKAGMVALVVIIIIFLMAIFAGPICRLLGIDPYELDTNAIGDAGGLPNGSWGGISLNHPLGVEPGTGRDLMARLLYGAQISLTIAVVSTTIITIIGTFIGIVGGYNKGRVDQVLGRFMDLVIAFPLTLMLLALSGPLTQRLTAGIPLPFSDARLGLPEGNPSRVTYLILVFSLFGWPYLARIVRGQVISLREREFVESAISLGAGTPRILFREILPNLWAPILVVASITLPSVIGAEAGLAFLGVSVLPPTPTWGAMLGDATRYFTVLPSYLFVPGMTLFIVVLAFNLLGDAVRDALDPRSGRV